MLSGRREMPFPKGSLWGGKSKDALGKKGNAFEKSKDALGKKGNAFGKSKDALGKANYALGKTQNRVRRLT